MAKKQEVLTTSFGRYLRSMRLERGFDNINDYVRHYELPITAGYYRDIENGRRTLNINSAEQICLALQADLHEFIYHFLKDMMPTPVFKQLKAPASVAHKEAEGIKDGAPELAKKRNTTFLASQALFLDTEIAKIFEADISLLDIASFIYVHSPQGVTRAQLEKFTKDRCTGMTIDNIISLFVKHGLIELNPSTSNQAKIVATKQSINWMSHRAVSRQWKLHQFKTAINLKYAKDKKIAAGTSVHYGIAKIMRSQVPNLIKKLATYEQTITNAPQKISADAPMYFFSLATIFRPEYK